MQEAKAFQTAANDYSKTNTFTAQLQEADAAEDTEIAGAAFEFTNDRGHIVSVPKGTLVTVLSYHEYAEPKLIRVSIDGESHQGEIDADLSLSVFRSFTVVADPIDKLERLRELLKEDAWYTNFGEEQAVSLMRGMNGTEISTLTGDSKLMSDINYYFSRRNWAHAVTPWNIDLEEKFKLIEQDDSGDQLDYGNDLRQMLFNSPHQQPLSSYEGRIKALSGTKVVFKGQLSPDEEAENEAKRPYDDQRNSGNHQTELDGDDLSRMARLEEGQGTQQDKDDLLKSFQRNALAETFAALELSEKQLQETLKGYTDQQMETIGTAFLDFMNEPSAVVPGKTNLEAYQHLPLLSQSDDFTPLGKALLGTNPVNDVVSGKVLQEKNQEKIHSALILKLGKQFPMLCDRKVNLGTLYQQFSDKQYQTINSELETRTTEYLTNIRATRENLRDTPEMVFALDTITANTFKNMGLSPTSASGKVVADHIQSIKNKELAISIALAALSIGLGILSAFTGGTTAIVAASLGAGVGVYDTYREYDQYQTKSAAANTSMTQAQMLTKDDPSFLWVAVAALGTLGDIASAAKVLRALKASETFVKPLQSADDVGRYVDEVTDALAKEKGIKTGSDEYKSIRELVERNANEQLVRRAQKATERANTKAYHQEKLDEALAEWRQLFGRMSGLLPGAIPPELVTVAAKIAYRGILSRGLNLDDFLRIVARKKKFDGLDVSDPAIKAKLEEIYKAQVDAIAKRNADHTEAVTNINALRDNAAQPLDATRQNRLDDLRGQYAQNGAPMPTTYRQGNEEVTKNISFDEQGEMLLDGRVADKAERELILDSAHQGRLTELWDQYLRTSDPIPVTYRYKKQEMTKSMTFNEEGQLLLDGQRPSRAEKELALSHTHHAIEESRHGMDAPAELLARRLIDGGSPQRQVGKFTRDEYLFKLKEYVLENYLHKTPPVAPDQVVGGRNVYRIPIPADWARVFIRGEVPSGTKIVNGQPFSTTDLSHVTEVEAKHALIVMEPDGRLVTAYPQSFIE